MLRPEQLRIGLTVYPSLSLLWLYQHDRTHLANEGVIEFVEQGSATIRYADTECVCMIDIGGPETLYPWECDIVPHSLETEEPLWMDLEGLRGLENDETIELFSGYSCNLAHTFNDGAQATLKGIARTCFGFPYTLQVFLGVTKIEASIDFSFVKPKQHIDMPVARTHRI